MTRAPLAWFRSSAKVGARWHAVIQAGKVYACGRPVTHLPNAMRADCRQADRCTGCARLVRVLRPGREAG